MATHQPKPSANIAIGNAITGTFGATSVDVEMAEVDAVPSLNKQEITGPQVFSHHKQSESKQSNTESLLLYPQTHEDEDDGLKEQHQKLETKARCKPGTTEFYCICGKPLKRYPLKQHDEKKYHSPEAEKDEAQNFRDAFRRLMKHTDSLTRLRDADHLDALLRTNDDNDSNEDKKEEESNENADTSQKKEESKPQSTESQPAIETTVPTVPIEDAMIHQINLQRTESSQTQPLDRPEPPETPKDFTYSDQEDSEQRDGSMEEEEKEDRVAEESEQRDAAQAVMLKGSAAAMVSEGVEKERDEFLNVLCNSCECDMDETSKRYECDDRECYTKHGLKRHVQYCERCYHQIDILMNLNASHERFIFREEGFEIATETDKPEREASVTDTEKSGPTNTPDTRPSLLAQTPYSGYNTGTETYQFDKTTTDKLSATSLRLTTPETDERSEASPAPSSRDYYTFRVKLEKMTIDHGDKEPKPTKDGDEKEEKYTVLKPMKSVICYPSNEADPVRVCYISAELNHLSISEKWETGNAELEIQLTVKLYWMLSENDYAQYSQLKRKNKRRNMSFNVNDIEWAFKPKINFYGAIGNKEHQEQQHVRLIKLQSFFGDDILKNLHMKRKSHKEKDHPWDYIRKLLFGYMAEVTYHCEVKIFEPFEIENFPFDCQDIPIIIEPINFHTLAPAYFGRTDCAFVTVTGDATNLGRWSMENTISEFNKHYGYKNNRLRIMLKLKRRSRPYLLEHGFLIAAVCFVSLSAFTIDTIGDDMKHERLAIVLGLILTLIFMDLPKVPRVTLLHWYFYMSFTFLTVLAMHFALGAYYGPVFLELEDDTCIFNGDLETWDDCKWYQKNYYNAVFFIGFGVIYVLIHITFIVVSIAVNAEENKKLLMSSTDVKKQVEKENYPLVTPSLFIKSDSKSNTYEWYENSDLFQGHRKVDEISDESSAKQRMANHWQQKHLEYNRTRADCTHIAERLTVLLFVIAAFIVLPPTVSILQFYVIESGNCEVELPFEFIIMILASGVQSFLCLLCILFWFGCCVGSCARSMFAYSLPVLLAVIVGNYVLAIRSYVVYHWEAVACNGFYRDLLYWLFLLWLATYGFMFAITFIKVSFTRGYVEDRGFGDSPDSQVIMLQNWKKLYRRIVKPKWQYFWIKLFTAVCPVVIQYPATVILLILLSDRCHNDNHIITVTEGIVLLVLSLVLHMVRSLLHGSNSFFYNFTYFMTGNVPINVLSFRALVFAEMYSNNAQCKESRLYPVLWALMCTWILYDNSSILGVILEVVWNYESAKHFEFKRFISTIIVSTVLVLQLPAFIGQLYMIFKNEVHSSIELTTTYCILCIAIIWTQILIYRAMQTDLLREYAVIPMFLFVSFVFLISMKSLVFWISVDTTTAASVIFAIVFAFGILADVILLAPATFIIPIVALYAYGGLLRKSGMFRCMMLLFVMFGGVQLPCCIMLLVEIWNGRVESISHWEGEILLLLTWVTLIIEFMSTYLYFDTNHALQRKVHPGVNWEPYEIYVKYLFFGVLSVVCIIAIHCFLSAPYGSPLWWFFVIWIAQYIIITIAPSFNIMWYMFCGQRDTKRWLNNAYVAYVVFVYCCIQLPACMFQLYMVEFADCTNRIGHTLDRSSAESFTLLSFSFIQMIGFYTIADVIGWTAASKKWRKHRDREQNRIQEMEVAKRARNKRANRKNYDDWREFGFQSRAEFKEAVRQKQEEDKENKWEKIKNFRKYQGPIFYVSLGVISVIQLGLVIHSLYYWGADEKEIDCGNDNSKKQVVYWLFIFWIGAYALAPIGGMGLAACRYTGSKWDKRQERRQKSRKPQVQNSPIEVGPAPKEDDKLVSKVPVDV